MDIPKTIEETILNLVLDITEVYNSLVPPEDPGTEDIFGKVLEVVSQSKDETINALNDLFYSGIKEAVLLALEDLPEETPQAEVKEDEVEEEVTSVAAPSTPPIIEQTIVEDTSVPPRAVLPDNVADLVASKLEGTPSPIPRDIGDEESSVPSAVTSSFDPFYDPGDTPDNVKPTTQKGRAANKSVATAPESWTEILVGVRDSVSVYRDDPDKKVRELSCSVISKLSYIINIDKDPTYSYPKLSEIREIVIELSKELRKIQKDISKNRVTTADVSSKLDVILKGIEEIFFTEKEEETVDKEEDNTGKKEDGE